MIHERIRQNLEEVQARIVRAAGRAGRPAGDVRLVAVTKKSSPEWIKALLDCGVFDLGENYPQELWKKSEALADRTAAIR
jgi:PLP dependent protein